MCTSRRLPLAFILQKFILRKVAPASTSLHFCCTPIKILTIVIALPSMAYCMARLTPPSLRHRLLCCTSRHICLNLARPVSSASTRPKALKAKPNNGPEFEMPQITFYEQDENMKSPPRRVGAISTLKELKPLKKH